MIILQSLIHIAWGNLKSKFLSILYYKTLEYKQRALGEFDVTLHRKQAGFGFRILSGDLTNPKVTIGNIVEGEFEVFKKIVSNIETPHLKIFLQLSSNINS